MNHQYFEFKDQVVNDLSSITGVDAESIHEVIDSGGNVSPEQAEDMLNTALDANPEVASTLRQHGIVGEHTPGDLERIFSGAGN